jgi:hypothetical protein
MSKIRSLFGEPISPKVQILPEVETQNVNANPDAPRRQHYYFAHQYLTERARENARFFVNHLREHSGTDYLNILWVSRGQAEKADDDVFISHEGLECFPVEINDEYYGVVIQFPKPERMAKAYFVAIIVRREDDDSNYYRFITLELSKDSDGLKQTVLGEWTKGGHRNYGDGGAPQKGAFLESLKKLFSKKR